METLAITVWKDGSWKVWAKLDAYHARNDPDWLSEISLSEVYDQVPLMMR